MSDQAAAVSGVVGVVLGGSRARGEQTADSDVDLGLYYRPPLDVDALAAVAHEVSGPDAAVTRPGDWGRWVDGGAWLVIDGLAVDWIYRDLDRVVDSWRSAQRGEYCFHAQVVHPLGIPDFWYAGELALGKVLCDPLGELTSLQGELSEYPTALADAVIEGLWEAHFSLTTARKAVRRADTAYVAGCMFRLVELCAHALHARARRWLINEKGAVASAGRLKVAPDGFAARAQGILAHLGSEPAQLTESLDRAEALLADVEAACGRR